MKIILAAILALGWQAIPASAQEAVDEVAARFLAADTDGDDLLDKSEFLGVALQQFRYLDIDKNNLLDADEVGEIAADEEFSDNDTNGDKMLSVDEVAIEKLADFEAADLNKDGALNLDEVRQDYSAKGE